MPKCTIFRLISRLATGYSFHARVRLVNFLAQCPNFALTFFYIYRAKEIQFSLHLWLAFYALVQVGFRFCTRLSPFTHSPRGFAAVLNSPDIFFSFIWVLVVLRSNFLFILLRAQINLNLKICKDSSVRKALVREASLLGAAKVVLGVAKKRRAIS